jgi:2-(1,2-epoxy-1,2-dihydrophenyl)acetyl-CoA isomerase
MSTIPTTSDDTLVEQHDGLVVVTLNRPEKKNAIGSRIWADLDAILNEVTVEPSCRALLLTGAAGNFSSGADLSPGMGNEPAGDADADGKQSKGGLTGRGAQAVLHEMRTIGEVLVKLQRLPKPTVAAVDGVCYGVGFGLAMACDLVVASDRARFCEVFVKRGMALDGGTSWTLPRAIGTRRAKQMAYFGEPVDAATALDWGLINEVVPADDLAGTGLAWAQRLASGPTTALSLIKRLIDGSDSSSFADTIEDEARAQHIAFSTKDIQEGIGSFLQKRDPEFRGF